MTATQARHLADNNNESARMLRLIKLEAEAGGYSFRTSIELSKETITILKDLGYTLSNVRRSKYPTIISWK